MNGKDLLTFMYGREDYVKNINSITHNLRNADKDNIQVADMDVSKKEGMKILVATDGSEYARKGLEYALSMALMNGGEIILLHVIPYIPESKPTIWTSPKVEVRDKKYVEELYKEAEKLLNDELERISTENVKTTKWIEFGEPAEKILEVADKANADLIVIGVRGKSTWKKIILGSVSDKVLDKAKIPVLVIR
ncbi:universal stress protein [Archaeoglobales archaeon]|nr:MAG: universal stress protein [Archaeoglobales archaeon]